MPIRARIYSMFSVQLATHIPYSEVLTQLFEAEQYELCSETVTSLYGLLHLG